MIRKKIAIIFTVTASFTVNNPANANMTGAMCDIDASKVIAACYTGRAYGFGLPSHPDFGGYAGAFTESWNLGAYDSSYRGAPFEPSGNKPNHQISVMPPYMWGAVGQFCDFEYNPTTHEQCASNKKNQLSNPIQNAQYSPGEFYWRAHGHNCHDAAEDVGMCLINSTAHMQAGCGFEAKIIVWDAEPDINKALGNVYHSQVLVKYNRKTSANTQEPMVCLTESQTANPAGIIQDSCCTSNLSLFDHGTAQDYLQAFSGCPNMYSSYRVYPHLYELASFREKRHTGEMDVPTTYNRQAGVLALKQNKRPALGLPAPKPKILAAIYDKNGVPLALNIR